MMTPPTGWRSVREDVAVDNPDYFCSLEEFRDDEDHQMVFIHATVKRELTLDLLKRFKREFDLLRKHTAGVPIFACAEVDDDKWVKFVTLFGFKPLSTALCTDGKTRRIYWHQGNEQFKTTDQRHDQPRALVSSTAVPQDGVQRSE